MPVDFRRSGQVAVRGGAWIGLLFALFSLVAEAQVAVGYDGNLPFGKDDDLSGEMQLGTPSQREGLLTALGVETIFVHDAAQAQGGTGIRVERLGGTDAALLFLPCSGPGSPSGHLYLLRPGREEHWHTVDRVHLDCWWQPTSYEMVSIPGKAGDLLLAHHVNHGHGSNMVEDHMVLFEARGDHLVNVLETQEYVSQDRLPDGETEQHSGTLLAFPDGSLEETRITTVDDHSGEDGKGSTALRRPLGMSLVERRRWRWVEGEKSYVPGKFVVVRP